jgi:hypothetical protein
MFVWYYQISITSPIDDINVQIPLIAVPKNTEVFIDVYPEVVVADEDIRTVPKVQIKIVLFHN